MGKIIALWTVLRKGEQVADPAAWKNGQITANALAALVLALAGAARAFGFSVEINDADALAIGGGVLAGANVLLTVATSRKVGLPAATAAPGPASGPGGGGD